MIRINLLPHREQGRRERRQRFYLVSGVMIAAGIVIGVLVHTIYAGYVERQERRNDIFKTEIKKLDTEIAEIKKLQEQISELLARKQVIEALQADRAQTVLLLNDLAQKMPEGVYLKSVKQNGNNVGLSGYAQSNARVSHLMSNLGGSSFFAQAKLVEVKSAKLNNRDVSEFTLDAMRARPAADKGAEKVVEKGARK